MESYAEFMETSFGPLIAAREAVGDVLHETYLRFLNDVNEADDGTDALPRRVPGFRGPAGLNERRTRRCFLTVLTSRA